MCVVRLTGCGCGGCRTRTRGVGRALEREALAAEGGV